MQKRAVVSISSAILASGSAPSWRDSPFSVCAGSTSAVVFCSRIACLDLGDRLGAILLEIAEDSDEARPELGPALLEIRPIDDVPSFVGHTLLLKCRTIRPWFHQLPG